MNLLPIFTIGSIFYAFRKEDVMKLKTPYGHDEEITKIKISQYTNSGNIAICMFCKDPKDGFEEPYDNLTKYIEDLPPFMGFVNIDNVPFIEEFIKENDLGKRVKNCEIQYRNVSYPLYTFNEEKLKELDKDGFDEYAAWCLENIDIEDEEFCMDEEEEI